MKINNIEFLEETAVETQGAKDVTMTILVGPDDGSENIIMRLFRIHSGGHTPLHSHAFEHLVKIVSGMGTIVDGEGNEFEVSEGHSIFIESNETHQFRNPYEHTFEFICVIPNPEKPTGSRNA